jgi:hypothetical protein
MVEMVNEQLLSRPALSCLTTPQLLLLLQKSINPTFVYMSRAAGYFESLDALKQADLGVTLHLQDALHLTNLDGIYKDRAEFLRQLPLVLGGLGIPTHVGPEGQRRELLVRIKFNDFIRSHPSLSDLLAPANLYFSNLPIIMGDGDPQLIAAAALDQETLETLDASTAPRLTREAVNRVHKATIDSLLDILTDFSPDQHPYRAFLRSHIQGGSPTPLLFLRGLRGPLPPSDVLSRLRLILGLGVEDPRAAGDVGRRSVCSCAHSGGQSVCLPLGAYHPFDCHKNKSARTYAHSLIVKHLAALLQKVYSGPVYSVHTEYSLGVDPHTLTAVEADIVVMRGDSFIHIIDVATANPAASCYLEKDSHLQADAASIAREIQKRAHYSRVVRNADLFVPFAVEVTGRLGPSAKAFLQARCGVNTKLRSDFLADMSDALARGVGRMMRNSTNHLISRRIH